MKTLTLGFIPLLNCQLTKFNMTDIKVFDNFILKEDCIVLKKEFNNLIDKFKKSIDNRFLYLNPKEPIITSFIQKYINKLNKELNQVYYVREILLSRYKPKSYLSEHIDYNNAIYKDNLGMLLYLNDDFKGGNFVFQNKIFYLNQNKVQ